MRKLPHLDFGYGGIGSHRGEPICCTPAYESGYMFRGGLVLLKGWKFVEMPVIEISHGGLGEILDDAEINAHGGIIEGGFVHAKREADAPVVAVEAIAFLDAW